MLNSECLFENNKYIRENKPFSFFYSFKTFRNKF